MNHRDTSFAVPISPWGLKGPHVPSVSLATARPLEAGSAQISHWGGLTLLSLGTKPNDILGYGGTNPVQALPTKRGFSVQRLICPPRPLLRGQERLARLRSLTPWAAMCDCSAPSALARVQPPAEARSTRERTRMRKRAAASVCTHAYVYVLVHAQRSLRPERDGHGLASERCAQLPGHEKELLERLRLALKTVLDRLPQPPAPH